MYYSTKMAVFSLDVTTVLVAVITLAAYALYRNTKRPANFPPGPTALPIVGNILLFWRKKSIHEVFRELVAKYGDLFSLKFATRDVVVLNTIEVVKEAMTKKAVEFAGRPPSYSMELLTEGYKDIALSDYGPQWRYQRKLGHLAIRHFVQKEQLEKLVFSVSPKIAKVLDEMGSKPFAPKYTIGQIVYNILATLCFSKQYEFNQPEILDRIKDSTEVNKVFGSGLPADYIPIFRLVPSPAEIKFKRVLKPYLKRYYDEFRQHRETFDPANIRDFFDSLLLTQKEAIETGEEEASRLTDTHLVQTVVDIFEAGTETTILTLHWAVAQMAENPDIQERVAREVDEVIGRDRMPSLDDRGSLPYTEATILENFRYGSVAPYGVPRSVTTDTVLRGYNIPKGTTVMINHMALHFNNNDWTEPDKFKPEHFLDDNGQLFPKPPESLLPFGCGRRVCLGEDFAKKEIFLLFTWLFSRYTFYKVPGKEKESLLMLSDISGMVHQPQDEIEVCVKKRF